MGKGQRKHKQITFSLREFHEAPPLAGNKYLYVAECFPKCGKRDCSDSCTFNSIPLGGIKEFYICTAAGLKIQKWAETFSFDGTPNTYKKVWQAPPPVCSFKNLSDTIPEAPNNGYFQYTPQPCPRLAEQKRVWRDYVTRKAKEDFEYKLKAKERAQQRAEISQAIREAEEERKERERRQPGPSKIGKKITDILDSPDFYY